MQSLFFFIVALAILIVIHEYGHFWVARRCGVKVLRFSVGFGKPLWSKTAADGTEYVLAPIPLGGYVKMLDEREGDVASADLERAFNRQSLSKRVAIVAAGPIANLLFAVFAYWLLFVAGIPGIKPVISEVIPASVAETAGFMPGDEIQEINGRQTPIWNAVYKSLLREAEQGGNAQITVLSGGTLVEHRVHVPQIGIDETQDMLTKLGLVPLRPMLAPVIGDIVAGEPADKAGLQPGDRLLSADGVMIDNWQAWVELIQQHPEQELEVAVQREEHTHLLTLIPASGPDGIGRIGVAVDMSYTQVPEEMQSKLQFNMLTATKEAVIQTWLFSASTLESLWGMLNGTVSTENLGGPISIAQIAGSSAEQGWISFVSFLAMISITLGILNLLPIPMLDGGHLAMFMIEAVRGKPLSEQTQIKGQQIGFILLAMLMFFAFFNDLSRLFG